MREDRGSSLSAGVLVRLLFVCLITSSQTLAYTISKFTFGILVDFLSPRLLLSAGLILSGASAFCFAGADSLLFMCGWWTVNGLSQGAGWPSIAVILKHWCPAKYFGTVWSIMSTSMNLAGTIGPIATAFLVKATGWRICLQLAGMVSVLVGFITLVLVKNKPENKIREEKNTKAEEKKTDKSKTEENLTRKDLIFIPGYLGVCICYLVTALVQHGVLQWSQLYLIQERGQMLLTGSTFLSSVDIGGIVGSFAAGFLSDYMISKNTSVPRYIVRRTLILYFLTFLSIVVFVFSISVKENSYQVVIGSLGFAIGIGTYGPISMFGVVAMEIAPEKMAGTSHAIAATFSNVGIMAAGLPLSYVAKLYDLQTAFLVQGTLLVTIVTYLLIRTKRDLTSYNTKSKHWLLF
ncbi:hypothetical protein FSP39_002650 [Pinctada imbricata]|uniref:Major facilitator superfamily (MFS) profile domain-containing protein n=1 Tax=Pinctada imbricata TaxID=66713 RepID=A0AA88YPJ5_PINIB|nr:hypothetical protein FSP39_002650 [Pinctada imbricata]